MLLTVNDQADLSGHLIRRIKYLLYRLKEKFDQILFSKVYIDYEGTSPKLIQLKIIIGIPGQELVYGYKHHTPDLLIKNAYNNLKRQLSKRIQKNNQQL